MGGLEEPQPAVLDERDPPAAQLDLQQVAVVPGAEQDGLVAQRDARLVVVEDRLADRSRLGLLVTPPGSSVQSCLRYPSPASAITALAKSRMGAVDR